MNHRSQVEPTVGRLARTWARSGAREKQPTNGRLYSGARFLPVEPTVGRLARTWARSGVREKQPTNGRLYSGARFLP
ncbi:MAG: hypothetical protein ABS914_16075, partial [Stenotrophomonas sp.]